MATNVINIALIETLSAGLERSPVEDDPSGAPEEDEDVDVNIDPVVANPPEVIRVVVPDVVAVELVVVFTGVKLSSETTTKLF